MAAWKAIQRERDRETERERERESYCEDCLIQGTLEKTVSLCQW